MVVRISHRTKPSFIAVPGSSKTRQEWRVFYCLVRGRTHFLKHTQWGFTITIRYARRIALPHLRWPG